MTDAAPYEGRLTTLDAILRADELVAAFDKNDGTFAPPFFAADRDVLGALVALASLGVREVAARDNVAREQVRQSFRLGLTDLQASNEQNGDRA